MKRSRDREDTYVQYIPDELLCLVIGDTITTTTPFYTAFLVLPNVCRKWQEIVRTTMNHDSFLQEYLKEWFWKFVKNHPPGTNTYNYSRKDFVRRDMIGLDCVLRDRCYGHQLSLNLTNIDTASSIVELLDDDLPIIHPLEMFHIWRASTRLPSLFLYHSGMYIRTCPIGITHTSHIYITTTYKNQQILLPLWELRDKFARGVKMIPILKTTSYKTLKLIESGKCVMDSYYYKAETIDMYDIKNVRSFYSLGKEDGDNLLSNFDMNELRKAFTDLSASKPHGELREQFDRAKKLISAPIEYL